MLVLLTGEPWGEGRLSSCMGKLMGAQLLSIRERQGVAGQGGKVALLCCHKLNCGVPSGLRVHIGSGVGFSNADRLEVFCCCTHILPRVAMGWAQWKHYGKGGDTVAQHT